MSQTRAIPLAHVPCASGAGNGGGIQPGVMFDRVELTIIFNRYGREVIDGVWRDYAIDMLKDRAVFSIFRRASEFPLYRIQKVPALARKQGAYSIVASAGQILKRGNDLRQVLRVLDRPRRLVVV